MTFGNDHWMLVDHISDMLCRSFAKDAAVSTALTAEKLHEKHQPDQKKNPIKFHFS